MFKNSPLIKAKTKDKREIYAFQFTGTDENISKIVRTVEPLFEDFIISIVYIPIIFSSSVLFFIIHIR
jgi:hypothetical protein